jgi:hypothetical protein
MDKKLLVGFVWSLAACSGSSSNKETGGGDGGGEGSDGGGETGEFGEIDLAGECPMASRWGTFIVESNEDGAYLTGQVTDGVVPVSVLTLVTESGECKIWRRENPFCDPTCGPGETCSLEGECVPYPVAQDLGQIRVDGLLSPVTVDPLEPGFLYSKTDLANPPWTAGEPLRLKIPAGALGPAELEGVGPVDLQLSTAAWEISDGQPLLLSWTAPPEGAVTELIMHLRIDQHGTTPSTIECHFADDGEGEVPAELISALVDLGLTGFPAGDIARRTADSAALGETEGCVDLFTTSARWVTVDVAGYTPCRTDGECPEGQTCNEELERCE